MKRKNMQNEFSKVTMRDKNRDNLMVTFFLFIRRFLAYTPTTFLKGSFGTRVPYIYHIYLIKR